LKSLASNAAPGYQDDVTLGGHLSTVTYDVAIIVSGGASLGLGLNPCKCEDISNSGIISHSQFAGYRQVPQSSATLLGSPLSSGLAMDSSLSTLSDDLRRAVERRSLISSHDALILLKNCLGGPKLQYVMKTSPCCDHPLLWEFDDLLRTAVTKNSNVTLSDDQWTQASLPVRFGGLGVCIVSKLASSAFLASAVSTLSLQTLILRTTKVNKLDTSQSLINWRSLSKETLELAQLRDSRLRACDEVVNNQSLKALLGTQSEPYHRARLLAASAAHSGH